MFNVGGGELIVILLIALIVLGPKRLPDAARKIGKAVGDLRRMSDSFQGEMRNALEGEAMAQPRLSAPAKDAPKRRRRDTPLRAVADPTDATADEP